MTPDEADNIATQLTRIWPNARITPGVWQEPLRRLDPEHAQTTLKALRDTDEHAPTIARFLARHREIHQATTAERPRTPYTICDGLGWEIINVNRPHHPHTTTGVIPCRCANGQPNLEPHRRTIHHNDQALHRTTSPPDTPTTF